MTIEEVLKIAHNDAKECGYWFVWIRYDKEYVWILGEDEDKYSTNKLTISDFWYLKYDLKTGKEIIGFSQDEIDNPLLKKYPVPEEYGIPERFRDKR